MRTDEFFMAFAEIDDDLIANAKPMAQKPIILKPERRSLRKTFVAAAACLAVAVIGIAAIIGVIRYRDKFVSPNRTTSVRYPDEAKYKYEGDFSELELCSYALVDRIGYSDFDSLEENSDLIVVGTFVDDARQNQPPEGGETDFDNLSGSSYNKLRIDEVYKGGVGVGDEIVIRDSYYVNDGRLMYIGSCTLTPMIKGEQWVYFLRKQDIEYGDYYYPLFTEGRYPIPGNENTFVLKGYEYDVDNYPKDTYADVKIMLGHAHGVQKLNLGDLRAAHEFTMPEFIGDKFVKKSGGMYVSRGSGSPELMFGAPWIESVYLADLNGDGKREIISECRNSESENLANYITVYDHANSKLYTLRGLEGTVCYYAFEIKNDELYVWVYSVASIFQPYEKRLTLNIMTEVKPELEQIVYKGTTYELANRKTFDNGVELSAWLTKREYGVGEKVDVLAMVKNGSDKPIGMLTPTQGGDYRDEFHYNISLNNEKLQKMYMGDFNGSIGCDCAMGSTVLQPGETFSHVQWFDTQKETFNSEGSIKPWYKPLGDYAGSVGIGLLEEPNNTSSKTTELIVDFSVRLVQREDPDARGNFFKQFTMNEFPNAEFTCTENSLSVTENGKNTVLFDGVGIDTLYLYDLNGDGKRELCSSAHFGSGIVDYRIMVYDFADRKLYRLSDRGYYDYQLVSVFGYGDSYSLYFEKYRYSSPYQILNDVLTLDKMVEIENGQPDTRKLIKGVTEIISSPGEIGAVKSFTMEEFPGITFYITEKSIKAVDNNFGEKISAKPNEKVQDPEKLLCDDAIESVYLYDLNADGRREIVFVCDHVWSVHSYDPPKKMIVFLDYENSCDEYLFCKNDFDESDYYSLAVENGELYISAGGEVLHDWLTFDKVIELRNSR